MVFTQTPTRSMSMNSNMSDMSELTEFSSDNKQAPQNTPATFRPIPTIPGEYLKGEHLLDLAETRSNMELAAQYSESDGTSLTVQTIQHRVQYALQLRAKKSGRTYNEVRVEHNQIRTANGVKYLRAGKSKQGGNTYTAPAPITPALVADHDGDIDMDDENASDDEYWQLGGAQPNESDHSGDESVLNDDGEAIEAATALMSMRDAGMDDDETVAADEENENILVVVDQETIDAANTLLGLVRGVTL